MKKYSIIIFLFVFIKFPPYFYAGNKTKISQQKKLLIQLQTYQRILLKRKNKQRVTKLNILKKYRKTVYSLVLNHFIKKPNYFKAIRILKQGLKHLPEEIWFYANIAYCYNKANLPQNSIPYSEKALKLLKPHKPHEKEKIISNLRESIFKICSNIEKTHGLHRAIKTIKKYLKKYHNDYVIVHLAGNLYMRAGDNNANFYLNKARNLYHQIYPRKKAHIKLLLPFRKKNTVLCVQGNLSGLTHSGFDAYAWDFMKVDTNFRINKHAEFLNNQSFFSWKMNVFAPCSGRVIKVIKKSRDNVYPSTGKTANTLVIEHNSGFYIHLTHLLLNSIVVKKGDMVKYGDYIGKVGNSGFSKSPHLHVMVTDKRNVSVPAYFTNVKIYRGKKRGFVFHKKAVPTSGNYYKNGEDF